MIAEALTLGKNFGPWFAGVAIVAFLAGGGVGFKGGTLWSAGKVASAQSAQHHAETALTDFKASFAAATAAGETNAAAREAAAHAELLARYQWIEGLVAGIPGKVRAQWQTDMTAFRSSLNDPSLDCLRISLPGDSLRLLERPGGVAPADR